MTCDEGTGEIVWEMKSCPTISYNETSKAEHFCNGVFESFCEGEGECVVRIADGKSATQECGECKYTVSGKTVLVTFEAKSDCPNVPLCDGNVIVKKEDKPDENGCPVCTYIFKECVGKTGTEYDNCENEKIKNVCSGCLGVECGTTEEYEYSFDRKTGKCSITKNNSKQKLTKCYKCNTKSGEFELEKPCGEKTSKTFTFSEGVHKGTNIEYSIDIKCLNGQCIVNPNYDCSIKNSDIKDKLLKYFRQEDLSYITATYHYSELFNRELYSSGLKQSQEFIDVMDKEAYCTWTISTPTCYYWNSYNDDGVKFILLNKDDNDNAHIDVTKYCKKPTYCKNDNCIIPDSDIFKNENCKIYKVINEEKEKSSVTEFYKIENDHIKKIDGKDGCDFVKEGGYLCYYVYVNSIDNVQKQLDSLYKGMDQELDTFKCGVVKCNTETNVSYIDFEKDNNNKEYCTDRDDIGCKQLLNTCNKVTGYCDFITLTTDPSQDKFKDKLDGIHYENKCIGYKCEEEGKSRKWIVSFDNTSLVSENLCKTIECDPDTGKIESKNRECVLEYNFPNLAPNQRECFECSCSPSDGSFVLQMLPSSDERTYSLDACGSCEVRDSEGNIESKNSSRMYSFW